MKFKPTGLRTVKFWVRILPRVGKQATRVHDAIYRTKRDASEAKRSGEMLLQVKGMYFPPPSREGTGEK